MIESLLLLLLYVFIVCCVLFLANKGLAMAGLGRELRFFFVAILGLVALIFLLRYFGVF